VQLVNDDKIERLDEANEMEVRNLAVVTKNPKRIKQLLWSKDFRERTQHLSIVPRPQCVRTVWVRLKKMR